VSFVRHMLIPFIAASRAGFVNEKQK
jgi:hypothetical protein